MKSRKLRNKLVDAAGEKDLSIRGIKVAAVISEALSRLKIEPVLVGGSAVAFYTTGKYTTADIDMIAPSGKDIDELMSELGFSKLGKDYINKKFGLYVEFPSSSLGPTERTNIIDVAGIPLKIISIEDLIVDRLCIYKYSKSSADGVNALIMLEVGTGNTERIEERAREEDVLDALDYIEELQEKIIRQKLNSGKATALLEKFFKR